MAKKGPSLDSDDTLLVTRALDAKKAAAKGKPYNSKEAREARLAEVDKNWSEGNVGMLDRRDLMTPAQRTRDRVKDAMKAVVSKVGSVLVPKKNTKAEKVGSEQKSVQPPVLPQEAREEDPNYHAENAGVFQFSEEEIELLKADKTANLANIPQAQSENAQEVPASNDNQEKTKISHGKKVRKLN